MPRGLDEVLPTRARDALLSAGHPREFRSGEVIFHQGDASDCLYLLRRGVAAVRATTSDGNQVTLGLLVAPDEFGEVGLLQKDHHHTATVVALEPVLVLTVPAARFAQLRTAHPDLTDWLLDALVQRLRRTSDLLSDALFLTADARVARRLLDCSESLADCHGAVLPLTQDDLAAMAGVSRPTANRVLRRFEAEGVVRLRRRHIEISQPERLRRLAR
jgi:CRP/FNR family cyclic AMP-dependent transcriptional regulator